MKLKQDDKQVYTKFLVQDKLGKNCHHLLYCISSHHKYSKRERERGKRERREMKRNLSNNDVICCVHT